MADEIDNFSDKINEVNSSFSSANDMLLRHIGILERMKDKSAELIELKAQLTKSQEKAMKTEEELIAKRLTLAKALGKEELKSAKAAEKEFTGHLFAGETPPVTERKCQTEIGSPQTHPEKD